MSSDSQDFVWNVDWNDLSTEAVSEVKPPPPVQQPPSTSPPFTPTRAEPQPAADSVAPTLPPPLPTVAPISVPPSPQPVSPLSFPVMTSSARPVVRGQRVKLSDLGLEAGSFGIGVHVDHREGDAVDVVCLGLDAQSRLSDERYFIYFNQLSSPCGGLALLGPGGEFQQIARADLCRLPSTIERLVFAAAFESDGTMATLGCSKFALLEFDRPVAEFHFSGADLGTERALIIAEIYRRDGSWRLGASGQGFADGLAALLRHYGAQVAE